MRVTGIKLANVRSIKKADLSFQPGFNLVVGDNGVGKTTLLDALASCLFEFERVYNNSDAGAPRPFGDDDIRVEAESLDVECNIEAAGSYHFVMHRVRGQNAERPLRNTFVGAWPPADPGVYGRWAETDGIEMDGRPLAVMYTTARAVASETRPKLPIGGVSRAYDGALTDREVRLGYFASWMKVRQTFDVERYRTALSGLDRSSRGDERT
ncbi:MAG: ATP-binding protein [Spirochaetaceae bacterium]|nr:ATP-binding protein [Spirochaetaceae bacterium]